MPSRRDRHLAKNIAEGDLQYELRRIDWRRRLNTLEEHWLSNDSTNSDAYLSQLNEAWEMAYICIWTMHGKSGQYANYTDDERSDAAVHMKKALMNYDPSKQGLVKYVEQKANLLLKGAWARGIDIEYDAPDEADDPKSWEAELLELQSSADGTADWAEHVGDFLYARFASRIRSKFPKEEQRQQVLASLKADLMQLDLQKQTLPEFTEHWCANVLNGAKKAPDAKGILGSSLDDGIGEDGETTKGEMIPADIPSIEAQTAKRLAAWDMLLAMAAVLNFQHSMDPKIIRNSEEHRHHRMCFTERILFLAKFSTLPNSNRQDVIRALLDSYLRHFTQIPEGRMPVNLAELTFKPMEQILDPASDPDTWTTPLQWSGANDFLPAKVPISYLKHRFGVSANDGTVNQFRKDFYKAVKKLAIPHYSADDIKEILSQR